MCGNQGCPSMKSVPPILPPLYHILMPLNLIAVLRPSKKPEEMLREYMPGLTSCMQARENASARLDMALVTGTTACSHSLSCRLYLHQYCLIHIVLSNCLHAILHLSFSSTLIQCLQKSILSLTYWILTYK